MLVKPVSNKFLFIRAKQSTNKTSKRIVFLVIIIYNYFFEISAYSPYNNNLELIHYSKFRQTWLKLYKF